jgi:hypothetical protein
LEDRSSERRKVVPFHRAKTIQVLAEVGGPIDEMNVTLALYSEDLQPEEVSRALGVEPTSAHRRGENAGSRSPPYLSGAWLLTERGRDGELAVSIPLKQVTRIAALGASMEFGIYAYGDDG